MNKQKFLILILFIVLICSSTTTVWAQTNNTSNTNLTQEDMVNEAQNDIDRSIDILNIVATLIGVLVAILAIIVAIAAALGIINRIAGKEYKEDAEKSLNEVKKIAAEATPIFEGLKNMEKDIKNLRNRLMDKSVTKKPSEELKKEVNESEKNIKLRESFGIPLTSEDYYIRAADYSYKNDHKSALNALNKALELDPNDVDIMVNKAVALIRLKRLDEALEVIDKAISLNSEYAVAWYNKACIYSLWGDKDNALKTLARAIKYDNISKEMAKDDEDFKNLWDDEDFKKLVE